MDNSTSTLLVVGALGVGAFLFLRRSPGNGPGGGGGGGGFSLTGPGGILSDVHEPPTYPNVASAPLSPAGGSTQGALAGFVKGGVKGAIIGGSFLAYGPLGPVAVAAAPKVAKAVKNVWDDIF
jgi:hypothetical protein